MKKLNLFVILFFISIISIAQQLSWLQIPNFPGSGKRGGASFTINNMGYAGLGFTGAGGSTDWYQYDAGTNAWTQKASFPTTGSYSQVSFVINSIGYVVAGAHPNPTNEVWAYDPTLNTWTSKAALPVSRENAAGFSLGNKGYVGTGYAGGSSYVDFYEYDPATDMWTQKADFPGPARNGAAGFSIGNKGYIGLGNSTNSTDNFNDFYEYDPSSDTWTQKADHPISHLVKPTCYTSGTDGYVLCGYYYQQTGITHNPMNMLYKYDPANNVWTLEGTFIGLPRGYAFGFNINNDIYLVGGGQTNGTGNMLSDSWKLSNGLTLRAGQVQTDVDVAFAIGPNPAGTYVKILSKNNTHFKNVRIYDSNGRLLQTQTTDSEVNVSGFSSGLYFIEVITDKNQVLNGRFVKE